ncbi:hypothetical protein AGDE_13350 [Angomonas deanei]|nr:hypothetical protein AGDE_13350 [Angomonas deanei]|eukprot:EPY22458.1 hypothetical protein AGDE_13350 [Angomonas deanei]
MAEMGHTTVSQALQTRFQLLQQHLNHTLDTQPPIMRTAFEMSDEIDLDIEQQFFNKGPSPGNEKAFLMLYHRDVSRGYHLLKTKKKCVYQKNT